MCGLDELCIGIVGAHRLAAHVPLPSLIEVEVLPRDDLVALLLHLLLHFLFLVGLQADQKPLEPLDAHAKRYAHEEHWNTGHSKRQLLHAAEEEAVDGGEENGHPLAYSPSPSPSLSPSHCPSLTSVSPQFPFTPSMFHCVS